MKKRQSVCIIIKKEEKLNHTNDYLYDKGGTPKNQIDYNINIIGFAECKGNWYLIFKIQETEKKIKILKKQAEIEALYPGFDNLLCLVTSTLNMYISDGDMKESFLTDQLPSLLDKYLNHDKNSGKYGELIDFNHFSNDIAKGLGLSEYYEFCYKDGKEHKLKSEQDFYNLDPSTHPRMKNYGKYGIAEYTKKGVPSHFMLLRREQHDRINPSEHDDYIFKETRFVFSQKIDVF